MSDRLPPLTALRAFDAAARHLSFARAAAELNVTPAALSFQIKSLEDHLGVPLFHRLNRAVKLTEAGRTLAPGAADGFQTLGDAWQSTRRLQNATTLNVTAGPAFTSKWLAPRLYDFARANPGIDLRFSASLRIMDFDRDEMDIAIRYGYDVDPGLYALPLRREWLTPVMTPDMAARYPTPESLRDAPLFIDHSIDFLRPRCDWPTWFRAVGIRFTPEHGAHFSQADHAIDAALSGAGVVLGRRALVVKDLTEGTLIAPYKIAIRTKAMYWFLCRKDAETHPQVRAFHDWILAEVENSAHICEAMTVIAVEDVPPA